MPRTSRDGGSDQARLERRLALPEMISGRHGESRALAACDACDDSPVRKQNEEQCDLVETKRITVRSSTGVP